MSLDLSSRKGAFKEYDIRGIYPDQVDEELVREVSRVLAEQVFKRGKVIVGHDARHSSPSLYRATVTTLSAHKDVEVTEAGMITTPMLTFLVNHFGFAGGIIVTASHNPKQYNGIKVLGGNGSWVSGKDILKWLE